jgi:hypothetical protein
MVVSPKVEKFEPKDGDVISSDRAICIFKEEYNSIRPSFSSYVALVNEIIDFGLTVFYETRRPATEEEKKLLFYRLKEEGLAWDAEKKEVVKIRWKPSYNGEYYFKPRLDMGQFIAHKAKWLNDAADNAYDKKGWIFKTNKKCQEFCYKLNQAIEGVKP